MSDKETWEGDIFSYVHALEEKVRELTVERDSETRWAKEYFDKWEKAESHLQSYKDENEQLRQNYNNLTDEFNQTKSRLEEKMKAIQEYANNMGEIIDSQTMKRIELEGMLEIAESRTKQLETDLKLNASMLARQCDLAREAESRLIEITGKWESLKFKLFDVAERFKRLQEAMDKFLEIMNGEDWREKGEANLLPDEQQELYKTRDEV